MSSDDEAVIKSFAIERAKQGRAKCYKCKSPCESGKLRLAKLNPNNPFGSGPMKTWYHVDCFLGLKKTKNSKTITSSTEVEGWQLLSDEDKKELVGKLGSDFKEEAETAVANTSGGSKESTKDNSFSEFQKIVEMIGEESSYKIKSQILQKFLLEGTSTKFKGDLELWLRMLMVKDVEKRVYNLQSKQIVKLFSRIFKQSLSEMQDDLNEGDVSETVAKFFAKSKKVKPADKSTLSLMEIDAFLSALSELTHEDRQVEHFEEITGKCTAEDLRTIIRLIKHDLKMNCGSRFILDALHPDAYACFQKSRDLKNVIKEFGSKMGSKSNTKSSSSGLQLMTAISPMLAEPCKDFDKAIQKNPGGFYSEIKYDGERVQIHKLGSEFKFFSRNLKPVLDHKVSKLKEFLPKAFPHGNDLILDSEILMVDTQTGDLLPFGTLGKYKKQEHSTAVSCLFIFDCLYFNGKDLTSKPMKERRKFLEDNLTVIKHHVQLSEYRLLKTKNQLVDMTKEVLKKGLEGLVLKGLETVYEPGKRRWLKVKKDYLLKGAIADTADLVVLGAWFGTGKKGGIYSIFLMGCYDEKSSTWKTVTKVHSGLDDLQMDRMHERLRPLMEKCDGNMQLPKWIHLNRSMIPNALAKDPKKMPVFEITGAEFTQSDIHTASSISIRFPRITRIRDDKSAKQATSLEELVHLFDESKSGMHLDELNKLKNKDSDDIKVDVTSLTTNLASTSNDNKKRKSDESEADSPKKKPKLDKEEASSTKEDLMFAGYKLFNSSEIKEKCREEIKKFEKLGGVTTESSTSANLVLHFSKQIEGSPEALRKLYNPNCRHFQAAWLTDSLQQKKTANPLHYFVKLHQI